MKIKRVLLLLLCVCMVLSAVACAPQSEPEPTPTEAVEENDQKPEETPADDATPTAEPEASEEAPEGVTFVEGYQFPSLLGKDGQDRTDAIYAKNEYMLEEYAPERVTLSNGVEVQPIAADPYLWNTAILDMENRGCNACHDLASVVQMLPMSHPELASPRNVEVTVDWCFMCHRATRLMGDGVHMIHLNSPNFDGNCMSCHYVDPVTGEYSNFDTVKYDIMYGITDVANVSGEFSWNQTYLTDLEDVFFYWGGGNSWGIQPNYVEPEEDEGYSIFENWQIQVEGEVENPGVYNLKDWAEAASVTKTLTIMCTVNEPGGSQVANLEVTGIPFSYIAEVVGMKDTCNAVANIGDDGWNRAFNADYFVRGDENNQALLVYKINGEYLPAKLGYPCQVMIPAAGAGGWTKRPVVMEFQALETAPSVEAFDGVNTEKYSNDPNATIFDIVNGQFFAPGRIDFEGFAYAYQDPVVAVEFSLDRGKTWTRYDTPGASNQQWVYWNYGVEINEPGSYVLRVRAVVESGQQPKVLGEVMFNVE